MRTRTKTIISAIIVIFVFSILFVPGQYFKAEEIQGSPAINITGSWVNPYYVDIQPQPQPANSLYPMDVATPYSADDEAELGSFIYQAFTNRKTYPQITYAGDPTTLGDVDENGNLINTNKLRSLIESTINADDYLKFNMVSYPYTVSKDGASCLISFIDNRVPEDPKYVSYLTTLDQEYAVDTEVARILSENLEPGMNPHQKVKAIHDYIVSNVAYDEQTIPEHTQQHSAYAALYGDKKTVCQGYALLAYKMLKEAGLQARIIGGTAGGPHAWNMVEIEDQWYYMDCTWDDPDDPDDPGRVIYNYYNLSNDEIIIDHTADETDLPEAGTDYMTTLNNLITLNNELSDIYLRMRHQMEFDYFLSSNTIATDTELETKIMISLQQKDSDLDVRYKYESEDIDLLDATVTGIISRRPTGTNLSGYTLGGIPFNRGGASGYWLVQLGFTYSVNNVAPAASSVAMNGYSNVGQILTGTYTYNDTESNKEGLSQYQWYRSDNAEGTNKTAIPGAIGSLYTVSPRDANKYLFLEVVPVASAGTLQGISAWSAALGPIGAVLEKAAQPATNVATGQVSSGTTVTLSTTTEGASIYYTLDGTTPTKESGTLYDWNPITIDAAKTFKAITVKEGMIDSDIAVFAYTITGTDECFIATAAFGSKFDWPVALLRHFRDQYLLTNDIGTAFVNFYYRNSPPIAAFIAQSEPLKMLVRALLAPVIAMVYMIYHPTLIVTVMGLFIVFLVYRHRQRRRYA